MSQALKATRQIEGVRRNGRKALERDPRQAVLPDGIVCLICGAVFRQLTSTHLHSHGVTALEYKQRFGYNLRRPLMCETLRRFYQERAIRSGLAARIRRRPIVEDPELRRRGGQRPISLEELLTRREAWRRRNASANGRTILTQ